LDKLQKHIKYKKDIHPNLFFEMCKKGYTLIQIADEMGGIKEDLLRWGDDKRKFEWQAVWERGLQAAQAYHEREYLKLIREGQPAAVLKEYQYYMKTQFPKDWAEKPKKIESEVKMRVEETLTDDQLERQLTAKHSKVLKKLKPELRLIEGIGGSK
jgi:hypothetical protein